MIRVPKRREKQQSDGDCTTNEFKITILGENTIIVISMFNKISCLQNMKNSTLRVKQSSGVKQNEEK